MIVLQGGDMDRRPEFAIFVRQHGGMCRMLSPDPSADGLILPLEDAVILAVQCPDAAVILGSTFAVVFGEPVKGGRDKYLLSEERGLCAPNGK